MKNAHKNNRVKSIDIVFFLLTYSYFQNIFTTSAPIHRFPTEPQENLSRDEPPNHHGRIPFVLEARNLSFKLIFYQKDFAHDREQTGLPNFIHKV